MTTGFFSRMFGGKTTNGVPTAPPASDFETLNRRAPILDEEQSHASGQAGDATVPNGFICRETVLGRDQKVAGYHFMLQQATQQRLRTRTRQIHHVYADVLVRNILKLEIERLLAHRKAFVDLPDTFLDHPSVAALSPSNTVLTVGRLDDGAGLSDEQLVDRVTALRKQGFHIAIEAHDGHLEPTCIVPLVEYVIVRVSTTDPRRVRDIGEHLHKSGSKARLVARDVPSIEDFQLAFNAGASFFQGSFITRREDWSSNKVGPNTARIADLLGRLRRDADIREIADVIKHDPGLSVRLMRYMNSASIGLRQEVTSIERALLQLGRDKLYRWLMLLIYGADKGSARSSALLESALVRARMMELLGENRPAKEREALFLVGLLSLVDAVLQVPMAEAMSQLAVAPEIESAVLHGEGQMGDMLQLTIACEADDVEHMATYAEKCRIEPSEASTKHLEAFAWAMDLADS